MTTRSCSFDKSQYRQLRRGYDYEIGQQVYPLEKNPLGTSCQLLVTFVCVCVCVCVCLRPFTMKALSVWISWDTREQINDVMLKTLISYAKSLHRYFRMQNLAFLSSHFILFAH